jgi:hypothetical protein
MLLVKDLKEHLEKFDDNAIIMIADYNNDRNILVQRCMYGLFKSKDSDESFKALVFHSKTKEEYEVEKFVKLRMV